MDVVTAVGLLFTLIAVIGMLLWLRSFTRPDVRAEYRPNEPHKIGMRVKKVGFVNIYRSGYFHTCGKAGAFDRHPGDIYSTLADARDCIEPMSHYMDTTYIEWWDNEDVRANAPLFEEARPQEGQHLG